MLSPGFELGLRESKAGVVTATVQLSPHPKEEKIWLIYLPPYVTKLYKRARTRVAFIFCAWPIAQDIYTAVAKCRSTKYIN